MKKQIPIILLASTIVILSASKLLSHPDDGNTLTNHPPGHSPSKSGQNIWNMAQEPKDWWNEIKNIHGHVGPWNVLGWRIGQAALRELGSKWGEHELDVVCYIPLEMPYSCLADGLVVGTGNSLGRLDIRLAETFTAADIHVSIRHKDKTGPVLIFKPSTVYLEKIRSRPADELEALAHECGQLPEKELFTVGKIQSLENSTSKK